ncbi:O-antigen ligase family protein [Peribacillus simplex]|uniref:O-antigen ligase family protein n=1 Tax=Peribacillus simplex TaxID=1478 RepID=UPI003D2C54AA
MSPENKNQRNPNINIHLNSFKLTRLLYIVSFVFSVIFLCYTIQAYRKDMSTSISALLFISWFISSLLANPMVIIKLLNNKKYLFLFLFIIYYFLGGLISGVGFLGSVKLILAFLMIISPMIIADYYEISKQYKKLAIICLIVLGMFAFISIKTIIVLETIPNAARALASGSLHNKDLGSLTDLGIGGGYDLAYALCLLVPFIAITMKKKLFNDILPNVLCFLWIVLAFLTIVKSDYGMAFLITIIALIITLFFLSGSLKKDSLILGFLLVFSTILYFLSKENIANLLMFISTYFENSFIGQRLTELASGILGNSYGESAEYRFILYERSFNAFIQNPFIGVGFETQYDYYKGLQYLGGHSEWLDMLGTYGIFGSIPLITIFSLQFYETMRKYNVKSVQSVVLIIYLLFIVIGSINLIFKFGIMVVLFLVIPAFPYLIKLLNNKRDRLK